MENATSGRQFICAAQSDAFQIELTPSAEALYKNWRSIWNTDLDYSKLTYNNPFAIKRFSHRSRFDKYWNFVKRILGQNPHASILDYGAGDGFMFVHFVRSGLTDSALHAYEPVEDQFEQLQKQISEANINVECMRELRAEKYDIVICAETLEHFSARNVLDHLRVLRSCLKDHGNLLISVPVEIGIAGLAKNTIRMLMGQSHSGQTAMVIWKSFLGRPFFRSNEEYIPSHLGFSHLRLEYLIIESDLIIKRRYFGPIPFLGGLMNSQVFFECVLRRDSE